MDLSCSFIVVILIVFPPSIFFGFPVTWFFFQGYLRDKSEIEAVKDVWGTQRHTDLFLKLRKVAIELIFKKNLSWNLYNLSYKQRKCLRLWR